MPFFCNCTVMIIMRYCVLDRKVPYLCFVLWEDGQQGWSLSRDAVGKVACLSHDHLSLRVAMMMQIGERFRPFD